MRPKKNSSKSQVMSNEQINDDPNVKMSSKSFRHASSGSDWNTRNSIFDSRVKKAKRLIQDHKEF